MNIAIITGASSGLGAEIAKAVARRYDDVQLWLIGALARGTDIYVGGDRRGEVQEHTARLDRRG